MGAPVEWLMFWSYVLVMVVTHWAYRDVKRDADGVRRRWMLPADRQRQLRPVAELAVTHERFRLSKQFVGLCASAWCLYLPGDVGAHAQTLRVALLVLCGLMLLNTLHGVRVRRGYFRTMQHTEAADQTLKRQLEVLARKETA